MEHTKGNYIITIGIKCSDNESFEISLNHAVDNIKLGNVEGYGSNDEEKYQFNVTRND